VADLMLTLTPEVGKPRGLVSLDSRLSEFLDSAKGTSVKFAPSSGAGVRTLSRSTASATFRFSSRASPWASPHAPPALSLRWIGRQVVRGPASKEEEREETFPSPVCPAADEGGSTKVSVTGCVPPTVATRGGEVVSLNLAWDRVSMLQPILNRLGV